MPRDRNFTRAYVTGFTHGADFPTTVGAMQTTFGGGNLDAFLTKLNPTGSAPAYSTYVGGGGEDRSFGVAVDGMGNAYLTGHTYSTDFPTTAGAYRTSFSGLHGNGFVAKVNPSGSGLSYSTFLGGDTAAGFAIAVDTSGNAYLGGIAGPDFPTTPSAFQTTFGGGGRDVIVTMLNPSGSALVYSTYLGGSAEDNGYGIALDTAGNAYVTGATGANFPTTSAAFQTTLSGSSDAFVAKVSPNTASGTNVSASAGNGVTVTFTGVVTQGETAAATSSTGPTPPAGFSVGGSSYYAITTTATFVPPVTICIVYDPAQFNDPVTLRMFHFENNAWTDVTTSNDPIAGRICGATTSLSPFLLGERTPLAVAIDIKPGAYPNTINLGSNGTVPVAILSTATFDARTVDPTTVTLASAPVKLTGKGKPMTSTRDVDGDGRLDLIVDVETSALQLSSTDTMAVLKGRTTSGQPIKGSDSVRVVPQ